MFFSYWHIKMYIQIYITNNKLQVTFQKTSKILPEVNFNMQL